MGTGDRIMKLLSWMFWGIFCYAMGIGTAAEVDDIVWLSYLLMLFGAFLIDISVPVIWLKKQYNLVLILRYVLLVSLAICLIIPLKNKVMAERVAEEQQRAYKIAAEQAKRERRKEEWKDKNKPANTPKPSYSASGKAKKKKVSQEDNEWMDEEDWLDKFGDDYDTDEEALEMYEWIN